MKRLHHTTRHSAFAYPITVGERLYSILIWPAVLSLFIFIALKFISLAPAVHTQAISLSELLVALSYTLSRLAVAYCLALVCAIPLALLAASSAWAEKIFLPTYDILESIPILAFFPILIIFFVHIRFLNGAAIFILFLSMLWNIVFTVIGGLQIIPKDIAYAAHVFKIRGWKYFHQVIMPAIVPELVTGSILAVAQGWNLIIVAEVIHVYIPNGTSANDLAGIGSMLVKAAATGQTDLFVAALTIMILVIALINFFIWQKLLHYAQRFKFE